jgi:hypothetical protein
VSLERDLLPNAARWGAKFTDGPVMGSLSFVASFEPFVDAEKRFWLENFEVINLLIYFNFFFRSWRPLSPSSTLLARKFRGTLFTCFTAGLLEQEPLGILEPFIAL